MSIAIDPEKGTNPFYRPGEFCAKCGGKLALRTTSSYRGNVKTEQLCRKCGHTVPTVEVNVIRVK